MTFKWVIERAVLLNPAKGDPELPPALSTPARVVMLALLSLAGPDGVIPKGKAPSLSDLARMTGLGRSTVARQADTLDDDKARWITRHQPDPAEARSKGVATWYELHHPNWKSPKSATPGTGSPGTGLPKIGGGPAAGPPVVPERDGSSPAAGRIPIPDHPDLDQSKEDDRNAGEDHKLDAAITGAIRERTGTTIPASWLPNAKRAIFETADGRPRPGIRDPIAYALAAIANEPDPRGRFLPSPHATPTAPAERPDWCGEQACDPATRLRDDNPTGLPARCRCHPLYGQPLARAT